MATVFDEIGYAVTLGKGSKDGGRDILAERDIPLGLGRELTIVQCKKNREDRKVGEPVVTQLYGTVTGNDASRGLIVTTSDFTRNASRLLEMHKYRLDGKNRDDILTLLESIKQDPSQLDKLP